MRKKVKRFNTDIATKKNIAQRTEEFISYIEETPHEDMDEKRYLSMIRQGLDLHWRGDSDETLLHVAADCALPRGVEELVRSGIGVDAVDADGQTALMWAISEYPLEELQAESLKIMSTLLGAGANPDHASEDGWTDLMHAAEGGGLPAVRLLLRAGAHVLLQNHEGQTAHSLAEGNEHDDVAALLRVYEEEAMRPDCMGKAGDNWYCPDDKRVTHVTIDVDSGTVLRDTFNFATEERQTIARGLQDDAALSVTPVQAFHAVSAPGLMAAHQAYQKLGGEEPLHVTPPGRVAQLLPKPKVLKT